MREWPSGIRRQCHRPGQPAPTGLCAALIASDAAAEEDGTRQARRRRCHPIGDGRTHTVGVGSSRSSRSRPTGSSGRRGVAGRGRPATAWAWVGWPRVPSTAGRLTVGVQRTPRRGAEPSRRVVCHACQIGASGQLPSPRPLFQNTSDGSRRMAASLKTTGVIGSYPAP